MRDKRSGGLKPYEWQLDAEALLLRLDLTVIAGTGAGKTIPFILPLLNDPNAKSIVLVILPLKELQTEQVRLIVHAACLVNCRREQRRPHRPGTHLAASLSAFE